MSGSPGSSLPNRADGAADATAVDTAGGAPVHHLGWTELTAVVDQLADRIEADGSPDVLVGVLRGGMVPTVLLAHRLGCRQVRAVEVTHTISDVVNAAKTQQPVVANPTSLGDLHDMDVLVVDDIAGTGATTVEACHLAILAGARRVRSTACVVNIGNWSQPDPPERVLTYLGHLASGWVIFPWEQ